MTEEERVLAILHIGMMLARWDDDNPHLVSSLQETQSRVLDIFGVDLHAEPNILEARDKIATVIEVTTGELEIH